MDKALELETTGEDATRMQAAVTEMLAEMKSLRLDRRRDQSEIEQSQTETRALLETIADELAALKAFR